MAELPESPVRKCERCERNGNDTEVNWCVVEQAWLCYFCYCRTPGARTTSTYVYVPPPYKPPKQTPYARMVREVNAALDRLLVYEPIHSGKANGEIYCYCPVCHEGVMALSFTGYPNNPGWMVTSSKGRGYCSAGCHVSQIQRVIYE